MPRLSSCRGLPDLAATGSRCNDQAWHLLEVAQWIYNQTSVAPLSPSKTKKNSPYPAQTKNQPTPKTASTLVHEKVNHRTRHNSLDQEKLRQLTETVTPQDKRENPEIAQNPHIGQIQHAYRSLISCCAEKANLTGAAAARKGRKKGSRSLGESRLPLTTRQNMSFTTEC